MITKSEFIKYLTEKLQYTYNQSEDTLIDKEGYSINVDTFLDKYKKKTGQSFECIYDEHACLVSVLKCTECGTVIFEHYDEDYEPHLKCPTCTDYKTGFKYYTKEEIEQDEDKQKEIDMYYKFTQMQKEADERYIKRGNLYDFEKTQEYTIFKTKNYKVKAQIKGFSKWDLFIEINVWKRNDDISYTGKKHIKIPLSPYSFYIQFIYKHLGICHKDLRSKWYIGTPRELR
jgi:uncharacterized Zn finger protein (UPF0148 family)